MTGYPSGDQKRQRIPPSDTNGLAIPHLHARIIRNNVGMMQTSPSDWFGDSWWRFYVNDRDGMSIACNHDCDHTAVIPAHTLAILPAWLTWSITISNPVDHFWIEVDCPHLSSRQIKQHHNQVIIMPPDAGGILCSVAARAFSHTLQAGDGNLLRAGVHCALATLAANFTETLAHRPAVHDIIEDIQAHLHEELRIPELAARHHMSAKTLTNLWQEHLGTSPAAFIRERRVGLACRLLRETDLSIESIAERVGYATRAYLSRIMKQDVGMAPAAYRQFGAQH